MVVEEHFEAANGRWSILYLRVYKSSVICRLSYDVNLKNL
jgi:hypothetical protein